MGHSSLFRIGVAIPQFKEASQNIREADQGSRKGIELPQRSGSASENPEWKRVSTCYPRRGWQHDETQIWSSLVSLSSEVFGGRHLGFPGFRCHVYG